MSTFQKIHSSINSLLLYFTDKLYVSMVKLKMVNWTRINKHHIFAIIDSHLVHYPAPVCLT